MVGSNLYEPPKNNNQNQSHEHQQKSQNRTQSSRRDHQFKYPPSANEKHDPIGLPKYRPSRSTPEQAPQNNKNNNVKKKTFCPFFLSKC
jgi:hypothetical protein